MNENSDTWRIWDNEVEYGNLLFKRAIGALPEMESSKATAKILKDLFSPNDRILDVGCGAGHYLRSLRRYIQKPFSYTGVDATAAYITLATDAWRSNKQASFQVADVFSLPFDDGDYDIVMSCNLFLHLPSIREPLNELLRVSRKNVLIRTMVGERSFRIKEVYSPETHPKSFSGPPDEDEFDNNGEPYSFHYYNIYSNTYISKLLRKNPNIKEYKIIPDDQYDPAHLIAETGLKDVAPDTTKIIDRWQVNGYILQPWAFILINKK